MTKDELPAVQAEATELDDSAKTKALVSNVLYGVGGLAVAVGVVLLLLGGADAASVSAPVVAPAPGGMLLVWEGTL